MSEALDLSEIVSCYEELRGQPPYHPVMMTAVLLFSSCQGIYSSRRMAKACRERDHSGTIVNERLRWRAVRGDLVGHANHAET